MRLNHLTLTDHRNIKYAELTPDPHLTVLCGPNGQGKTNLLEAVWLLTGGKKLPGWQGCRTSAAGRTLRRAGSVYPERTAPGRTPAGRA